MTTLTHNIMPTHSANTTRGSRPPPLDCRAGGQAVAQLAREYRIAVNGGPLGEAELIDLGEARLRELLGKYPTLWTNAKRQLADASEQGQDNVARLLAGNAMPQRAAVAAVDEFAGYSVNDSLNAAMGTVDGDMLRLVTDVKALVWGASEDQIAALGEVQLKALQAHFSQA